jgi:hypothetical protein
MVMSWPCMFNLLEICCWARHYGLPVFVLIYLFVLCIFYGSFLVSSCIIWLGWAPPLGSGSRSNHLLVAFWFFFCLGSLFPLFQFEFYFLVSCVL